MNRRDFIASLAAFSATRPWKLFAADGFDAGTPGLRFGVLSDIHIRGMDGNYGVQYFVKALAYFRDNHADGVVLAGDLADFGRVSELQCVADAWEQVFPNDTGADGRHVEKLFVYGNHDTEGWTYDRENPPPPEDRIATDPKSVWERVFREPYAPIWKKSVKGYTFFGAHWDRPGSIRGLDSFMKDHAAELQGDRPFFYIQHAPPRGTCHGPAAWGQDDGCATRALSAFPNAVSFAGHSHHPLSDERAVWQGAFTSIGTASMRYVMPVYGRENSGPSESDEVKQMPIVDRFGAKHGMLVSVFDDPSSPDGSAAAGRIVIRRREFVTDGALGPDWVIPLPASEEKPFAFDVRKAESAVPVFADGSKVTVSDPFDGKDRKGRPSEQITVSFPSSCRDAAHPRAHDYEIVSEVDVIDYTRPGPVKRVYSPACLLPAEKEPDAVTCVFATREFGTKKGSCFTPRVRFAVRAADAFGHASRPLVSDWMDLP